MQKRFELDDQSIDKLLGILKLSVKKSAIDLTAEQKDLFVIALTHKSFFEDAEQNISPSVADLHYDRLEFLGDAILKTVINECIFTNYIDYNSGKLTKLSAYLLSDKVLVQIAQNLKIASFVICGARIKPQAILGDIVESLFAAIYLVFGFDIAKDLILRLYKNIILEADASELKGNYKAALQEYTQSRGQGLPEYILISRSGTAHEPIFEIEIRLGDKILGKGKGASKKEAGQKAAQKSLEILSCIEKI